MATEEGKAVFFTWRIRAVASAVSVRNLQGESGRGSSLLSDRFTTEVIRYSADLEAARLGDCCPFSASEQQTFFSYLEE